MKDSEGYRCGTSVRLTEGTLGTVVGRPRQPDGKYLVHCKDGVKRAVRSKDFVVILSSGAVRESKNG